MSKYFESWYTAELSGAGEQGDLWFKNGLVKDHNEPDGYIILDQTCDIENNKLVNLLVASVFSYNSMCLINSAFKGSDFRKSLVNNQQPAYLLLPPIENSWNIVSFRNRGTVDLDFFLKNSYALKARLVSPYREHFAQSIGNFYNRVALPTTLHEFISVKHTL